MTPERRQKAKPSGKEDPNQQQPRPVLSLADMLEILNMDSTPRQARRTTEASTKENKRWEDFFEQKMAVAETL